MNNRLLTRRRMLYGTTSMIAVPVAGCLSAPSSTDRETSTSTDDEDQTDDDNQSPAPVHEVLVGPDGDFVFTPGTEQPLEISPGDSVRWIWQSNAHNINPTEIPESADWTGHRDLEDEGFEYEYTFTVEGNYHYICDPHVNQGMVADLIVGDAVEEPVSDEPDQTEAEAPQDLPTEPTDEDFVDMTGMDSVEIITRHGTDNEPAFLFDPPFVRVDRGATIRWVNTDGVFHTVTSTPSLDRRTGGGEVFNATISSEGDTFEWVADSSGRQDYYCSPHAGFMFGSIEVD